MSKKRWSVLVLGYALIVLVTVMLGALSVPSSALAEGGGGSIIPPPANTDTTSNGSSVGAPIISDPTVADPSTIDLLLITIDILL